MPDLHFPTREEMHELSPLELAKTHCLAEDAGDIATVVNTFSSLDPYYRIPSLKVDLSGIEEIRAFYTASLGALPDLVNLEPSWIETPDHIFLTVIFEATFSQPWGDSQPTGNRIHLNTFSHFPIAPDGMLLAEIVHLDSIDMYHQMGLLPTADINELTKLTQRHT